MDNGTECEIYDTDAVLEIDAVGRFCTRNVPGVGDGCVTDRVDGTWKIDARGGSGYTPRGPRPPIGPSTMSSRSRRTESARREPGWAYKRCWRKRARQTLQRGNAVVSGGHHRPGGVEESLGHPRGLVGGRTARIVTLSIARSPAGTGSPVSFGGSAVARPVPKLARPPLPA